MKVRYILIAFFIFSFSFLPVYASEKPVTLYFFHGSTCPHCKKASKYLKTLKKEYPNMKIVTYEVWGNEENAKLLKEVKKVLESDSKGVPFFVIGEKYLSGFSEYQKKDLKISIRNYIKKGNTYIDVIENVLDTEEKKGNRLEIHPVNLHDEFRKRSQKKIVFYAFASFLVLIFYTILLKTKKI